MNYERYKGENRDFAFPDDEVFEGDSRELPSRKTKNITIALIAIIFIAIALSMFAKSGKGNESLSIALPTGTAKTAVLVPPEETAEPSEREDIFGLSSSSRNHEKEPTTRTATKTATPPAEQPVEADDSLSGGAPFVPPHDGREKIAIRQGSDIMVMPLEGGRDVSNSYVEECTLGYVDVNQRRGVTAAHCGQNGDPVYARAQNGEYAIIGVLDRQNSFGGSDTAVIQFQPNAILQGNPYSTDAFDPEVTPNERMCRFGVTTGHNVCGNVKDAPVGGDITGNSALVGLSGDSGGPVWTDQGFAGIHVRTWRIMEKGSDSNVIDSGNTVSRYVPVNTATLNIPDWVPDRITVQ